MRAEALKGKRFGVPWFVLEGSPSVYGKDKKPPPYMGGVTPETRAAFMTAVEQMRAAGAEVVIRKEILPESFFALVRRVETRPYRREGVENFLREWGPAEYHLVAEWEQASGGRVSGIHAGRA